jgi:hypothetical protein
MARMTCGVHDGLRPFGAEFIRSNPFSQGRCPGLVHFCLSGKLNCSRLQPLHRVFAETFYVSFRISLLSRFKLLQKSFNKRDAKYWRAGLFFGMIPP